MMTPSGDGRDETVRLWDGETGELLHTFEGIRARVTDVAA
jgi:WD40 repeat protein